jgi:hypothetical protein
MAELDHDFPEEEPEWLHQYSSSSTVSSSTSKPAAPVVSSLSDDAPHCSCGSTYCIREILSVYGIAVCKQCKAQDLRYESISKSAAKDQFLLTDSDIAHLKFVVRDIRPETGFSRKMHLLLRLQVQEVAEKKYGPNFDVAAEKRKLELEKMNKVIQSNQKKRALPDSSSDKKSKAKKAVEVPPSQRPHAHIYDDSQAVQDPETMKWSNSCSICGFKNSYMLF